MGHGTLYMCTSTVLHKCLSHGPEVCVFMQLVDTEFREIQDAVSENERLATETTLKLKQVEGAMAGLLANAAEVRNDARAFCWFARIPTGFLYHLVWAGLR